MAKKPKDLEWIEELLPSEVIRKPMFGGFAYYRGPVLILVMFESIGDRTYKGQRFKFDLWNGCMFPMEKIHHQEALKAFPFLINHPVLPKWLYLPQQSEDFEQKVEDILKQVLRPKSFWGVLPKEKSKGGKAKKKVKVKTDAIDTSRPRMFSDDESKSIDFSLLNNISDLKNFGPSTEIHFRKAGIKTPEQFSKLGWKRTLLKLGESNVKHLHTMFAYALIGALENKHWFKLSEDEKREAVAYTKSLRDSFKKKAAKGKLSKK